MGDWTAGPWRVGISAHRSVVADSPAPGISGSDDVKYYGGHLICESVNKANACLIAAAPTLADHHERILDMVDRFRFESDADVFRLLDEIADQARAALALARGGA